MANSDDTTIAALATAPAPAGIAVVRISGPETQRLLKTLFKASPHPIDKPRQLIYGSILDYPSNEVIDRCLGVFMPAPNTFTGEDVGEFHLHGNLLLVESILRILFSMGAVPAEPGEFTKRAFLNKKLDLAQAEAICDFIEATSREALASAREQLSGRFSSAIQDLRTPLIETLAELEAHIDFPEEDIDPKDLSQIRSNLNTISDSIKSYLSKYEYGQVLREGYRVLIYGRPNAGKSTLLNALLGKDRAIVTDVPGTTRDFIEEICLIDGYRFVLCDTAGIRDGGDQAEAIGIAQAKSRLEWANLVLLVCDVTEKIDEQKLESWITLLHDLKNLKIEGLKIWLLLNKVDMLSDAVNRFAYEAKSAEQVFYISAKTGEGLPTLKQALVDEIKGLYHDTSASGFVVTNLRHRNCLERALTSIRKAEGLLERREPIELACVEIRSAINSLGEIIGVVYNDDILKEVFSRFCVGK